MLRKGIALVAALGVLAPLRADAAIGHWPVANGDGPARNPVALSSEVRGSASVSEALGQIHASRVEQPRRVAAGPDGNLWTDRCELWSGVGRSFRCPSVQPWPAGDLDGDGADEFLSIEHGPGGSRLIARRAVDAVPIWEHPIYRDQDGYAYVLRLADQDGTPDALVVIDVVEDDHALYGDGVVIAELQQRVHVLDPATGTARWTGVIDGTMVFSGSSLLAATDVITWFDTVPDVSGDELDEVQVTSMTIHVQVEHTSRVLAGASGATIASATFGDAADLQVAAGIDAGRAGLILFEPSLDRVRAVHLDGTLLWERIFVDHPNSLAVVPLERSDLADVIVWLYPHGGGEASVEAIHGLTGATRYSLRGYGPWFRQLSGDGTYDQYDVRTLDRGTADQRTEFSVADGADAGSDWTTVIGSPDAPDGAVSGVWGYPVADVTGDGTLDILANAVVMTDEYPGTTLSAALTVLDGADGSIHLERGLPSDYGHGWDNLGDLNRDGRDDLRLVRYGEDGGYLWPIGTEILDGATLASVATPEHVPDRLEAYVFPVTAKLDEDRWFVAWGCDLERRHNTCAMHVEAIGFDGLTKWELP